MAKGITISSARFREIRTSRLAMTQAEIAHAMGISLSGVQRIEGTELPSVRPVTLRKLAELAGVEPRELVVAAATAQG